MSYTQTAAPPNNQFTRFNFGSDFSSKVPSDCTFIFVWKPSGVGTMGLMAVDNTGGGNIATINPYGDNKIYFKINSNFAAASSGSDGYFAGNSNDGWRIDVFRKPGTGSSKFRHSWYQYSTKVWSHEDSDNNISDSSDSPGDMFSIYQWTFDSDEQLAGSAAAIGVAATKYSDSDCVGLENGIWAWKNKGVNHIVAFGQTVRPDPLPQIGTDDGSVMQRSNTGGESWSPGYPRTSASGPNPPKPWSYSLDQPASNSDSVFGQTLTYFDQGGDAPNWSIGIGASLYGEGSVTAIWFYPPAGSAGDYGWRVYEGHHDEPGGLLASGTIANGTYDNTLGWQRFPITPVDVTGINFIVAYYSSSSGVNNYVYWPRDSADPIDDGVIVTQHGGCFNDHDAKPNNLGTLYYGIDFEITAPSGETFRASQFFPFFE